MINSYVLNMNKIVFMYVLDLYRVFIATMISDIVIICHEIFDDNYTYHQFRYHDYICMIAVLNYEL